MLTVKHEFIIFDPLKCEENSKMTNMEKYHCLIFLRDIENAQVIKLPNESVQYIRNEQDRR